ncbi:hypothetical protein GSI_12533 [Ganoderma sinense ZZ0214-1]|uniref:WLM domain-containing protein n=1 Tax=Ganoderma sinense ZZ0214-1 TaxID=1077348 RepID=A0A2G8RT12_9APHY|nr:hypothetical protein GSI_12533 [Ganoderma sinense ZZ0214-1]
MESENASINLTFTHRGTTHPLSLLPDATLAYLHDRLEELTSVPPENQKLLYKGKKTVGSAASISEAGLKDGMKVQLIGATAEELGGLKATESEHQRKERILRERAQKAPVKARATGPSSLAASDAAYTFQRIEPLPHLPNPDAARALLTKLANDPAVRHVMARHRFAVGVLTELAPHEQPHLLGLNVNAGQAIKLRLRTDAYDGFRLYKDVRRVLCHELTHNVWGDHDNNFKELNSQLNRDVAEFERARATGAHILSGRRPEFSHAGSALEAEAQEYVFGGAYTLGGTGTSDLGDSPEERRRKVLEATMNRLREEEKELEDRCGTAAGHS